MANAEAWNQGWALGSERAQESRLHKQAMKDKEFLEQHDNLVKQRDTIEANLSSLKGTPDYDKAVGALTSAEKAIREHWNPDNTPPGMMAKFGHKLTDAVRLTSAAKREEQAKARITAGNKLDVASTQRDIAAAPLSPEQEATRKYQARVNAQLAAIENSGMSDADKKEAKKPIFKIYQRPNNKVFDVPGVGPQIYDMNDPDSIPEGAVPHEKPTVASAKNAPAKMTGPQLLMDSYLASLKLPFGTAWNTLTDAQRAGYELYLNHLKQRSGTREVKIPDREGNVHIVLLTSSSGPTMGGGQPSSSPGEAGRTASTGGKSGDRVLPFQQSTPAWTKLSEQHDAAVVLVDEANNAVANPNNAEMQFLLVDNILHDALGRVNEIEIKKIQDRGGWAMAPERWEEEARAGTMAPELVKQLRDFTISQKKAIEKQMAAHGGGETPQSGGTVKMKAPGPNGAIQDVPANQVEHYKSKGATVVSPPVTPPVK